MKYELYKAVKWQVQNYFGDHGMTVPEMWPAVNDEEDKFWRTECLNDYRNREDK